MKVKPENISIYARVSLERGLRDKRLRTWGQSFGTIRSAAKQYDIRIEEDGDRWKFSAPRTRLYLFMEKLHFSGVKYEE